MDPKTGPIRTPDSRLRVFVSSTLRELSAERRAVRASIERMRLAPVMFELGARPHPPRDLYRAYLEQSDIFVGIYWEKYGWVAPGEDVSGLEDEYNLAPPGMPRLIYIKDTPDTREDRLKHLLDRIRADDRAAFKYFSDSQELADLVVSDLAVLLAERFDQSRAEPVETEPPAERRKGAPAAPIPVPLTQLFGREEEAERIADMLRSPQYRLLTLTGPGGIGKTRLAIEVGTRLAAEFRDGVLFVPLAPIDDPDQVANAIAHAVGVQATGDAPLQEKLIGALQDRRMLMVLDNFEQVLPAAPLLKDLVGGSPGLKVLVTSRALLRVIGEQSVEVSPLELPAPRPAEWDPDSPLSASVHLLVARARSVKPDFELTPRNIEAVEAIATLLEGVPLALEIAAARLRMLTPADLLARLDRRLAMLVGGPRNLPPRQQAVRTTIEWSTRLLAVEEQNLLWRLGVFAGRFSLEAAECVAESSADTISLLEALVDSSLVRQQERNGRSYFLMLATVREYALERLEAHGLVDEMRERHADYYRTWTHQLGPDLIGSRQREYVALLNNERDNLRAAVLHLLDRGDLVGCAECAWAVWPFWWIGGMMGDFRRWMEQLLASPSPLPDRVRAIALSVTTSVFFWDAPTPELIAGLEEAAEIFERLGASFDAGVPMMSLGSAYALSSPPDLARAAATVERGLRHFRASGNRWGESVLVVAEGRLALGKGDLPGAIERFEQALAIGRDLENYLSLSISLHYLGWARLIAGQLEQAADVFSEALDVSPVIAHDQGVAWDLEGVIGIAITIGDIERAGLLAGAAAALRDRIGLQDRADAVFHRQMIEQLRQSPAAPVFDEAFSVGRRMSAADAVDLAWQVTRSARKVPAHAT
jgi:predicted ATPase